MRESSSNDDAFLRKLRWSAYWAGLVACRLAIIPSSWATRARSVYSSSTVLTVRRISTCSVVALLSVIDVLAAINGRLTGDGGGLVFSLDGDCSPSVRLLALLFNSSFAIVMYSFYMSFPLSDRIRWTSTSYLLRTLRMTSSRCSNTTTAK